MNNPKQCQRCGEPVPGNALVCPSCGIPAEGVTFFAPDHESSVSSGNARRGIIYWIGLLAMIGGSLASRIGLAKILDVAGQQEIAVTCEDQQDQIRIEQFLDRYNAS